MEKYIELLEEWVSDDRRLRNNSLESDFDRFCEEKNVAIENLINRVKELEEENKELMNLANNKQWISPCYIAHNYIPKSKIRENIEELDKMMEKINKGELQRYTVDEILTFKAILQDLLEDK